MQIFNLKNIVGLTSLLIASCAAYFSIIGISMLFSGSKDAAMMMASSLEIGKLVATSYLFRYWNDTTKLLRTYLTSGVIILMTITSLGIFGYLTASYQKSSLENSMFEEKISIYESQKETLNSKIKLSENRIQRIQELRSSQEKRLTDAMTNNLITRNPIQFQNIQDQTLELISKSELDISSENENIKNSNDKILEINNEISSLKIESKSKSDIVTFKFVADEFNMDMDSVVKWFIAIIISVFDPLAVCLLLAYNNIIGINLVKKN